MIIQPSKSKFSKAVALAVEDRKIPADKDYKLVMVGKGSTAQHYLYWVHFNKIAEMRHDWEGKHFFVSHASDIDPTSHLARHLTEWVR